MNEGWSEESGKPLDGRERMELQKLLASREWQVVKKVAGKLNKTYHDMYMGAKHPRDAEAIRQFAKGLLAFPECLEREAFQGMRKTPPERPKSKVFSQGVP